MKRQWFMLALQELPHRDGAAASLSLCYAACAVRCASHVWSVSQWLAARTGVPACLRARVPAWLGQAFVHAWADVEKILFY